MKLFLNILYQIMGKVIHMSISNLTSFLMEDQEPFFMSFLERQYAFFIHFLSQRLTKRRELCLFPSYFIEYNSLKHEFHCFYQTFKLRYTL